MLICPSLNNVSDTLTFGKGCVAPCVYVCVYVCSIYESRLDVQHTHEHIHTHTIDLPISKMARYANEAKATVERTTARRTRMFFFFFFFKFKFRYYWYYHRYDRHTYSGYLSFMYLHIKSQAITLYKNDTFISVDPYLQGMISRNPASRPILIVAHPPPTTHMPLASSDEGW